MSDDKEKAPAPKAGGGGPGIVGLILPALLAAGAAFGGAKIAGASHAAPVAATAETAQAKPPGPTLPLEPFLVTVPDGNKKNHPMKVTIALEFGEGPKAPKEEELKNLVPRVRDTALSYFRTMSYETVSDPAANDTMRKELLEKFKASGTPAERVLITDLVCQ